MSVFSRGPRPHREHGAPATDLFDFPTAESIGRSYPRMALQQADCCVARAAYRVTLAANDTRAESSELFLCAHHYHASHDGLTQAKAVIYDAKNRRVAAYR